MMLLQFFQVVRSILIDIIIEPVGEQQAGVGAPSEHDLPLRVIVLEVVLRNLYIQSLLHVSEIFSRQGTFVILLMSQDEYLPPVFRRYDVWSYFRRISQYPQLVAGF